MDEYIIHYGVMGMKWGVRKDKYNARPGSKARSNPVIEMTSNFISGGHPEAKAKGGDDSGSEKKKKEKTKTEKTIETMNATGKSAKSGSAASKKIGNAIRAEEQKKIDLSEMSDAELQRRVNRMNLERQYNSLSTQDVAVGWDKAGDILDIAGDLVMIGVGIATIYKTFH